MLSDIDPTTCGDAAVRNHIQDLGQESDQRLVQGQNDAERRPKRKAPELHTAM